MIDGPLDALVVVALVVERVKERVQRRIDLLLLPESLIDDKVTRGQLSQSQKADENMEDGE